VFSTGSVALRVYRADLGIRGLVPGGSAAIRMRRGRAIIGCPAVSRRSDIGFRTFEWQRGCMSEASAVSTDVSLELALTVYEFQVNNRAGWRNILGVLLPRWSGKE